MPPYRSRPDLTPPPIEVTTPADGVAPGYAFLAPFAGSWPHGPLILGNAGDPVWFRPVTDATTVANFNVQTYQGKPVLTWWQGNADAVGDFAGDCVIADESYNVIKVVSMSNGFRTDVHEFLITPQNTALITMNDFFSADLTSVGGPAGAGVIDGVFQEVDIATGKVLFEWHAADHVAYDESTFPATSVWDWFHLNSVDIDTDGNFLVSARYTSAVYKVHRTSGEILWRLGGTNSDFAMGPGTTFAYQHDARGHAGNLVSVFDDGAYTFTDPPEKTSRALLLALDTDAMRCSVVRAIPNRHGYLTIAMGNAQRLADDGFMVGWGTVALLSEFDAEGNLRFEATLPPNMINYRAFRATWVGKPSLPPATAALRNANGSVDVYASWNGATEVASWRVLGGAAAGKLEPLAHAARTGFETRVRVAAPPAILAAAALDRSGRELGRSHLFKV